MQDGQNGAVVDRVEELVGMPAGGKGPRLRFAIADHACHDQVWIVERRTKRVRQRVSQFTAFVDRTWRFWSHVTRDAAGERELREQALHSLLILRHVRIDLAVRPFEIRVGDQARSAVPRPSDVEDIRVVFLDEAIQVHVDEVQSRRRAPMTQQPGLMWSRLRGFVRSGLSWR